MYRQGRTAEGDRWSFFRWKGFGWDSLFFRDGSKFIQFGRDPVKYICITAKDGKYPLFLLGIGWETVFCTDRIRVGSTVRPKNFKQLWEKSNAHWTGTKLRADRQLT